MCWTTEDIEFETNTEQNCFFNIAIVFKLVRCS